MKRAQSKSAKMQVCADQIQSRNQQIMSTLTQIFDARLIQRLSRPCSREAKEEVFRQFKRKLTNLHQLLQRTKKDTCKDTQSTQSRNKSLNSMKGIKQKMSKQDIKKIEGKYSEIFHEGSFKFYPKVAKLYGFPMLELINIHDWANVCLEEDAPKRPCC